jgi:hypothetical protein
MTSENMNVLHGGLRVASGMTERREVCYVAGKSGVTAAVYHSMIIIHLFLGI